MSATDPLPLTGENALTREEAEAGLQLGSGQVFAFADQREAAERFKAKLRRALDSSPRESEQRCGGSGVIVHPPSRFDREHGESRRLRSAIERHREFCKHGLADEHANRELTADEIRRLEAANDRKLWEAL